MLSLLKNSGYTSEDVSAEKLMSDFINGGIVNSGKYFDNGNMPKYPLLEYKKFLNGFADKEAVINAWGEPSGG